MRLLSLAGSLPATILENTPAWEWTGVLRLLSNPAEVRFVEITGLAGNFFDARLDRTTGLIEITPSARLDAESFRQAGRSFDLPIELRFFLADGTQAGASFTPTVRLLDVDDTPPQELSFASGGNVRAGQPGATIGRLQVSDPDTTGGFSFRLLEGDAWQFEVVGDELRLRPGVKMDLADGPRRPLIVEVSDGSQSAAFTLPIDVLPDPAVSTQPINLLLPGASKAGFGWEGSGVRGVMNAEALASITEAGGKARVVLRDGRDVWFNKPSWVDIGLGYLDYNPSGVAARAWLAWDTVLDRAPTHMEMQIFVYSFWAGTSEEQLIRSMVVGSPEARPLMALPNRDFVRELYENVTGAPPGPMVLNNQTARLDAGVLSRFDLIQQLNAWRTRFDDLGREAAEGFFVGRPHMFEIAVMLGAGMNVGAGRFIFDWYSAFERGGWSLRGLADILPEQPGFRAKWQGVGTADFVARFYREGMGFDMAPGDRAWWVQAIDADPRVRADLIFGVAKSAGDQSPFRQMPLGMGDDTPWF